MRITSTVSRLLLIVSIILFSTGVPVSLGQTGKSDSVELLKQLLAMPAPTPRGSPEPAQPEIQQWQPNFLLRQNPPPDDAPVEDLMMYWARWSTLRHGPKPPPAVVQRLFDYGLSKPDLLPSLLQIVPPNDTVVAKVKEIYDKEQSEQLFDSSWSESVKEWLLLKSPYFLSELAALARKAKDNSKGGYVNKQDALIALAELDWTSAEPLVRSLLASAQPRSSSLALSLLYQHAIKEKEAAAEENYRRTLQQIAADHSQPGGARDSAIQALAFTEWSGRDEWYLSLFQDETLIKLTDGDRVYTPLNRRVMSDPDKWIPAMARLLESKDLALRSAAASCLMSLLPPDARKDALVPLLPWLSNPSWINESAGERMRLIQAAAVIDLPESVPGLIWMVENEKDENNHNRSYAAYALANYKDPRAGPALKRALAEEKDEGNRHRIMQGLVACQGLSDTEAVQALEAFLAKAATPEGVAQLNQYPPPGGPLELPIAIGKYLNQMSDASDSLVNAVVARAESLKQQNSALAQALLNTAHRWRGRQVDLDMINRIANGSADANMVAAALTRRQTMIDKLRPELESLAAADGIAPGVGAVLLDDSVLLQAVLTSGDRPAQIAALACSRLTQTSLPVELVGSFLSSKDSLLSQAAELYLLADDSPEARELLWQQHPNEAFVTGWRESIPSLYAGSLDEIRKKEEKLRAELFKEDGPAEIFALLSGEEVVSQVLRVYSNKAVYTDYEDAARYRERTVSKAEVAAFRDYLTTSDLLDIGPDVALCHHGCLSMQFLMISKEKGRRVFSQQGFLRSLPFPENFTQFGDSAKIHYNLEKEIKGLEVLFDGSDLSAIDVWQHENGQLRLFVERHEEEEEEPQPTGDPDNEEEEEPDEAARLEVRRKELALERARFSWRVFANGELGDVASQPDVYNFVDPVKFLSNEDDDEETFETHAQLLTPNSIIIARGVDGLWKQVAGAKPVRIGTQEGAYANPIVTGDRKWVVVGKSDTDWSDPNYVVRLNLQTGREFRVKLEPADDFFPIAFLPNVNKVLLHRAKGKYSSKPLGPDQPEFYSLDAATGETRLVSGNFEPLLQSGYRFLQRTDNADEYWAAIPDYAKNETQIGRYSVRSFTFKQVMNVPHIVFDSMTMWVDGVKGKVYVVYKGQLLRLPLQAAAK